MRVVFVAALLGMLAHFAGSAPARATDMNDYRWDHLWSNCRVVEVESRLTNRWGDPVTIRRRVCI